MISKLLRLLLFSIIFSVLISCSKDIILGKYKTNFSTYGMFGKTLSLNCDSTVIMNFAGDLMNDNSYGKWIIINDTLKVSFDTVNYPNCRFKKDIDFVIRRHKLYNICLTRKQYDELIEKIRDSGNDTIKLPTYRKFKRQMNKNMTDFKGHSRRQYFKLVERFNCKK